MKRRSFLKKSAVAAGSALTAGSVAANSFSAPEKALYELKVYQFTAGGGVNQLKKFYTEAVIPFLNRRGAKVGVFQEYSLEDPPKVYILNAHKNSESYWSALQDMKTDRTYLDAAKSYFDLPFSQPVFERYETFILEAFDGIPQLKIPAANRGLLELRTYESYNEDAHRRKVRMFNLEEIPLFEKVGLHPVFFGSILAGRYMPALTYMLWFKDMDEREANWNKFRISDEWNTMRVKDEYANSVSKVRKIFLTPADISQI
ncbi:MAG: NIPSNAP family protein [Prolixibacteraceae bacterium]|nr:NIPSNAP family protein [Prolixibacteraceae bacterium]